MTQPMTEARFSAQGATPSYACQADPRFSFCLYLPRVYHEDPSRSAPPAGSRSWTRTATGGSVCATSRPNSARPSISRRSAGWRSSWSSATKTPAPRT